LDVLTAPASVAVGVPAQFVVKTYGGGCEWRHSEWLVLDSGTPTLVPWDVTYVPGPYEACTDQLLRIEHTFEVVFPAAGEHVVRVRGRLVSASRDTDTEVSTAVLVE
jgi:hypothetical protein